MTNNNDYYTGTRTQPESGQTFPKQSFNKTNPKNYSPAPGLKEAVNLAILMNQPLLLTGDPGTGKTQLAHHVAWELGLGDPLKFETRSTSLAKDLFYYFNSLGLFQARYSKGVSLRPVDYITYNALGLAILRSKNPDDKEISGLIPRGLRLQAPTKSVVLIDEIDKAPRDFPNDILNQIEDLYFRIPELENRTIKANPDFVPITIITSNSEKNLPHAFLRRCIFYHIEFPNEKRLKEIATNRLKDLADNDPRNARLSSQFISNGIDLFFKIRDHSEIKKKPATAELIVWLDSLRKTSLLENPFDDKEKVINTIGAVIKEIDDKKIALDIIDNFYR